MAYQPSLNDLGDSAPGYVPSMSDLPNVGASPAPAPVASAPAQNSSLQDILAMVRKILPQPSIPFGMNVAAGALSSPFPGAYRNALSQAPQIAAGEGYGIPQQVASGVGQTIPALMSGGPNILTQSLSGFGLGTAQADPGNRLQAGAENALTSGFLGKTLPFLSRLTGSVFFPGTTEDIAKNVQSVHDSIDQSAAQGFQDVSKDIYDRGANQVPLTLDTMNDISGAIKSGYFSTKKANTTLLNNALSGDYNSLRDLQSELWKKGTKATSSDSIADNNMGDEIFDLRDRINNSISNHLINTGNTDLNNTLQNSMGQYKYLMDTFYNKNIPNSLKKLVAPEVQEIPDNLGKIVQKKSLPMNAWRDAVNQMPKNSWLGAESSPFSQNIQSYNLRNSIWPTLKGIGYGGVGLGELAGLWKLYHPGGHGGGGSILDNSDDNS